jgi:hypothetical protein
MREIEIIEVCCPSCGERVQLRVEAVEAGQEFVEDCGVCCRPMRVRVEGGADGTPRVSVSAEGA